LKSRETKSTRNGDQVQSLCRAIALLNCLAESEDNSATLTDLSQQVGLSPSTAHRLLTTLEHERYVHFNLERRQWSVGVQAFVAGCAFIKTRNVVETARPHMRRLMESSGETVNLALRDENEAVFLAQVECRQMMRAFARPGVRASLHCTGVGKAMLSALPDGEVTRILQKIGMPRITAKTISAPSKLREEFVRIRNSGYALDDEETAIGLRCLAAPIFDEGGYPIGALSISGPMARIVDDRLPSLGALVRDTAIAITRDHGGAIMGSKPQSRREGQAAP
jgi:IclR family acetate operon transcriptional repressor